MLSRTRSLYDTTLPTGILSLLPTSLYIGMPHILTSKTSPLAAEQVHAWLARQLPDRPHPSVKRPINYVRWISSITMLLGIATVLVTATPYVLPIVQNRNVWAAISLIAILLFTSGHMFNHIRRVPYVAHNGKGGISYFAGGFQSQYGLETQVVAAVCKCLRVQPSVQQRT